MGGILGIVNGLSLVWLSMPINRCIHPIQGSGLLPASLPIWRENAGKVSSGWHDVITSFLSCIHEESIPSRRSLRHVAGHGRLCHRKFPRGGKPEGEQPRYQGQKAPISVGKFDNKSSFQNGVFQDGEDRLGNQSRTILVAHLQQTGRFNVLDRTNMSEAAQEAKISGRAQNLKGATYLISGDVTEFGRKNVGDHQLFGILGRGKKQVAYAKVTLNVVDVNSSEVVYSTQGAGEYELSNREVLGFGGTAGYDATLNGKVLDLAIREAVNNLVSAIESGHWTPAN